MRIRIRVAYPSAVRATKAVKLVTVDIVCSRGNAGIDLPGINQLLSGCLRRTTRVAMIGRLHSHSLGVHVVSYK